MLTENNATGESETARKHNENILKHSNHIPVIIRTGNVHYIRFPFSALLQVPVHAHAARQ